MKNLLLKTQSLSAPTVLRIALGLILLPHGLQKTFGFFGGYGFDGTMNFFTETMHIPWLFGLAGILVESAGPFLLIAGLGTRIVSALIYIQFVVIILTSHIQYGFFMNWFGNQTGAGMEYHLMGLAVCTALILSGGGKGSMDKVIAES